MIGKTRNVKEKRNSNLMMREKMEHNLEKSDAYCFYLLNIFSSLMPFCYNFPTLISNHFVSYFPKRMALAY